jgi:RHS repeat-associated protein
VNGEGDQVYYLLTDHLGSTAITVNENGSKAAEIRHKPWGETRYTEGSTPTDYLYTGQRWKEFGLYFFNARWFVARTLCSGRYGYSGWSARADRYAFVNNNPIKFIDPSGHKYCDNEFSGDCTRFSNLLYEVLSGKPIAAWQSEHVTEQELVDWLQPYTELPFQVLATLSDGENTLIAALKACWPQAPHQRCQAHFLNNLAEAVLDYDDQLRKNLRQDLGGLPGVPEHPPDTPLL